LRELAVVEPDRSAILVIRNSVFADQPADDALGVLLSGERPTRRDLAERIDARWRALSHLCSDPRSGLALVF
jgi:hypothetical protein